MVRMVVTPLPVAAVPAPAPIAAAPAAPEMLFTGMLQQLMTEMTPPLPPPPPSPSAEKQPVRLPLREHREPPREESEGTPAPPPPINFVALAPVIVQAPPPLLPPPLPPAPDPGPVPVKSDSPVPVAADPTPTPTPEAAVVVAVRNTDVVVVAKAPEVKEAIPPEHHDEIPESSAPIEPVVVARPPLKVEAPKPVAMPDQAMPEKAPVRAVAIEFRPDGVHDVRVRLAEHAGEVHVSVHSADPEVTQNLREGVTGLTATLAQAGYDARAWTPDQGQKQQQPREERAAKREKRAADMKFEGALEEISQ
jgi:hypothetical protein